MDGGVEIIVIAILEPLKSQRNRSFIASLPSQQGSGKSEVEKSEFSVFERNPLPPPLWAHLQRYEIYSSFCKCARNWVIGQPYKEMGDSLTGLQGLSCGSDAASGWCW